MTDSAKPRVLFVDDEEDLLKGIRSTLRRDRRRWEIELAVGGAAALDAIEAEPPDVVVSDMRMPGMDGAELLGRVRERHPSILRIALTGFADDQLTLRAMPSAHQWLSKPCDRDVLRRTLESALSARSWLRDAEDMTVVGDVASLPSPPRILEELRRVTSNPECQIADIAKLIERDPALSAKTLQLTNSAFFGLPRELSDLTEAIARIGIQTISALVLSESVSRTDYGRHARVDIQALQDHSRLCGRIAGRFAAEQGDDTASAYAAGLLHDIGLLMLPMDDAKAKGDPSPPCSYEAAAAYDPEHRHAAFAAGLLAAWGLPLTLVEAVGRHHDLRACETEPSANACRVHLANAFVDELDARERGVDASVQPDALAAAHLGDERDLGAWRAIAEEEVAAWNTGVGE